MNSTQVGKDSVYRPAPQVETKTCGRRCFARDSNFGCELFPQSSTIAHDTNATLRRTSETCHGTGDFLVAFVLASLSPTCTCYWHLSGAMVRPTDMSCVEKCGDKQQTRYFELP
ncbi:unnamed protein product [Sphacelaria rigidula]